MSKKLEHLGIAVADIQQSTQLFRKLLNSQEYKEEVVESEGVKTVFFKLGNTKIELLGATNTTSPIAKFLSKKKEGIHHIAINVDDIDEEIKRLKREGFELINDTPKDGADGKKIVFLHPKSTNGVLVELCMDKA